MDSSLRGRPHLCFLCYLTFLCAVPRMDKVHSPNLGVIKILPRELRKAKFSPPDCSANRRISSIAPATSGSRVPSSSAFTSNMQSGFQKGLAPFVKFFKLLNSKNQEVFGAPFVHFLAIGNGPRGAGAGSLPAKKVMQELSCNEQIGAYYGSNNSQLWNKPHLCQP